MKKILFYFAFISLGYAQNPILLDQTWYFEIGNINNEELIVPEVPEGVSPNNTPFQSNLNVNSENGSVLFSLTNSYCDDTLFLDADFIENENTFIGQDATALIGIGCNANFTGAYLFESKIKEFYGIETEASNTFNYTIESVDNYYKLTITNNDGDWLVYNSILLSNSTFNENTVSLFPNPVQNTLNIQNTASNMSKVQIFDLNGRLLQNHVLQSQEVSLDVSQLNSGVYVVVLENEMDHQITRKIVKN
jgi:hypothetical protein